MKSERLFKYETILYEKEDSIGIIRLNRPERMNALNSKLLEELKDIIDNVAKEDEGIGALIITGNEKYFSAGADITTLSSLSSSQEAYEFTMWIKEVFTCIENFDRPVIAAIDGYALGGGLELAISCDILIASDRARLGVPEVNLGAFPAAGGTQKLPRMVGLARAKEIVLTGKQLTGEEAYKIGLINKVVPYQDLIKEAKDIAIELSKKPRLAIKRIKRIMNIGINMDIKSALDFESQCFSGLFTSDDFKEGLKAFIEKRKPVFKGR